MTHHFEHHWCSRSRDRGSHRCFETAVVVNIQSSGSVISTRKQGSKAQTYPEGSRRGGGRACRLSPRVELVGAPNMLIIVV